MVPGGHPFVIVLADSLTIVLAGEHLGLMLGGGGHAGDFHLVAEVVPVGDAVVGQELRCRAMLEHDLVRGDHGLAGLDISQALCRPNLPARAVSHLVQEANLLVAREAGEGQRRHGLTGQVEWLIADVLVRLEAQFLSVADGIIAGGLARSVGLGPHEVDDRAGAGADSLLGCSHGVRLVVARDPVAHVADEPAAGQAIAQHDGIAESQALILSERVGNLNQKSHIVTLKAETAKSQIGSPVRLN